MKTIFADDHQLLGGRTVSRKTGRGDADPRGDARFTVNFGQAAGKLAPQPFRQNLKIVILDSAKYGQELIITQPSQVIQLAQHLPGGFRQYPQELVASLKSEAGIHGVEVLDIQDQDRATAFLFPSQVHFRPKPTQIASAPGKPVKRSSLGMGPQSNANDRRRMGPSVAEIFSVQSACSLE